MKCPKCQHENPGDAQFCIECGNPIELLCPQCETITPATGKFCKGCGRDLTLPSEPIPKDLSYDEKLDKIQRYLPKGLTEKILSQRDKIEGERKQVTVMFCDMEGFSPLVERIGSEEAYNVMDQVYEILIHKVHDYGGTVNEMTGDGIMALFGAPIALEDAPQRAIRSAYAIHREMSRFSEKMNQEKEGILPLKMRIGIHTGPVVVGTMGNDLRLEFKAVGETVNLASRMEDLAEPGATFVTEETFTLTEGLFRYESLGEKKVKGREKSVKTYHFIAPSTRRTRFDVSAERGLSPFIGRERELELLIDCFERAKFGRGQTVSVIAEPGGGKSRILYEFIKAISNENVTILEGKCLSYSKGIPYHPVIDILKSNFRIMDEDGDAVIKKKVEKNLEILGLHETDLHSYIFELFSIKNCGIDDILISREAKKVRIIEAVKQITLNGSEIRPVVIAVEDLHWIDESSEEFLKYMMNSIGGARIFLILTHRPDFAPSWGMKTYHHHINLNRLSNRESLAMITNLLDKKTIDRTFQKWIIEKVEGIPFFIEEFIKSLKDLKLIALQENEYHFTETFTELTIPFTIQEVIMVRVDSLPDDSKRILQTGSVIGREFSFDLMKRLSSQREKELISALSILKDSELLYERGIFPKSTYIFSHALIQDVVYDSILTKKRKELHEKISQNIEVVYKENIHEYYAVLAEHFMRCENYEKGAHYSKQSAIKAGRSASFTEAIAHTTKRIECLEALPHSYKNQNKIVASRIYLGLYYFPMNHLIEAKKSIDPIYNIALKSNNVKTLPLIYTILGTYSFMVEEDCQEAMKLLNEALKISEKTRDIFSSIYANSFLGLAESWNYNFKEAEKLIKKSLDILISVNVPWSISTMKSDLSYYVYNYQGKIDLGYNTSSVALKLALDCGDILAEAKAYTCHGISCFCKGYFEDAETYLLRGSELCEKIKLLSFGAIANQYLADLYYCLCKYHDSVNAYQKAICLREISKIIPSSINYNKIAMIRSEVLHDNKYVDLNTLYNFVQKNKLRLYDGNIARYVGEIILNINDDRLNEAKEWITRAIEIHKKCGMMWHLAKDYLLYAQFLKRCCQESSALENLYVANQIFKECGADGWSIKVDDEISHFGT